MKKKSELNLDILYTFLQQQLKKINDSKALFGHFDAAPSGPFWGL
jgi:hypothetical protein